MNFRLKRRIEVYSDAAVRLELARDWIEAYPTHTEILVIAHSAEAAGDLHLSLVSAAGAWFGIKRFTLNALAPRLAQHSLAASSTAPASNLSFTAVVARAIHSLDSEGRLNYFAPVVSRPGFPLAVAKTLEELRMNEVEPERLGQLTRGGEDLAAIAALVDQELRKARLSDRAILFRTAIESLDSPENGGYVGLPVLLLDVAVRSRLESRLLQELANRAPSVLATVPKGDERTIKALQEAIRCERHDDAGRKAVTSHRTPRSLSFVKEHLFEDSGPDHTPLDASVKLHNWPGEPRECVEIVRSIQAEAAQHVPFDQMAVLLNCPGDYRSHLEEAFARAEIPAYFVRGTTAPDPAGRAMLALLSCAAEGLSAKRFAEYLSLGQVPAPEDNKDVEVAWAAPEDELIASATETEDFKTESKDSALVAKPEDRAVVEGTLRAPARWERLLVDSAVIGGKDRWTRRLNGLANELLLRIEEANPEDDARVESIRKQVRDLDALRAYALPLIERLAGLPDRASWGEWLAHLRELAVNALRNPEGVMATLAELEPMSSVGPVDLHEVQLVLEARLHDLGVKPPKRRYGRVFIGPVDTARGLSFQVVFVPGLAERIFPRKIVEDPILPDTQRKEAGAGGLTTRREQLELERLGLRIAVGSARDRVYLSYPRIDVQQSRPRVPSFYALEALRAAEGALPGFEEIASRAESTTRARLGWPAPERPEAAIDEAEYDLALLANLVESSDEEATGAAHYLLSANSHLARALRARSRRWLRRWTPNDGLVDVDELARQSLAKHQFAARSFSATALQNYASCPYRFFLSAIHRFDLRQEPAAIEVIDPLTRGSLFHETQFEVLTRLKSDGLLPLGVVSLTRAFDLVDRALERLAADYEDRLAPAIPRVWQDGINSIRADVREWLRRMADDNGGWIPDKFELSFGLSDRGPRESDPASVNDPVELIGDFKLRGSIDMVERQAGDRFRVTDHKTGKARAEKETIVGGGKYLQPLLYALACQKLVVGRVESGRLYYCTADGGYEERVVPLDEANLQILNSVLITIRQGLADGFLPVAPDEDACTWCDFLAVCGGFEEIRTRLKPRDRLVQIKSMRDLP
ncbi:MAG TPA: PD-(D/E)XK nuclease family protein [Pyrinomonadaceae bacterium]|nr:PD-(D/E)XK nuclease family protein [Pyrinomonadaceae bacterium]